MDRRRLRPQFEDDEYEEEELNQLLRNQTSRAEEDSDSDNDNDDDDDGFGEISFGALKNAQNKMDQEDKKAHAKKSQQKPKSKKNSVAAVKETRYDDSEDEHYHSDLNSDSDSDSDSEGLFEEEGSGYSRGSHRDGGDKKKKKSKHAPSESSSKKRVSKIRQIPGLDNPKHKTLYKDIRFDTALGRADQEKVRKDYKFLDEYRQNEINQIESMLKNPKIRNKLSNHEIQEMEYQAKSLKSRLDSLKNRDIEKDVLKKYKEQNKGTNGNKFYLKKSEQRKIIQKHKFENLKASERQKVMERKRKRRLGKEFRQLEFNQPKN